MFLKTAVFFIGLLALVRCQTTQVGECIRNGGERPLHTYIEGCLSPPCQLPQLQNVVINIVFRAPRTMRSMRTVAYAYILGPIGIPYPLGDEANTCNFLTNTYCPVLQNEVVTYTLRMFIESWMAAGTAVTVEFQVVDENNTPVLCIRVPLSIVGPLAIAQDAADARNGTLTINVQ